jgi:hypothetical protein
MAVQAASLRYTDWIIFFYLHRKTLIGIFICYYLFAVLAIIYFDIDIRSYHIPGEERVNSTSWMLRDSYFIEAWTNSACLIVRQKQYKTQYYKITLPSHIYRKRK